MGISDTNIDKPTLCIHGYMIGKVCMCDSGYYTSTYQDPSQKNVRLCDTQTPQNSSFSIGPNGGLYLNTQSKNSYLQVPLSPIYKIIMLVSAFLLFCIFSCCCVKRLKKKNNYI